jgi:hypothetical protein
MRSTSGRESRSIAAPPAVRQPVADAPSQALLERLERLEQQTAPPVHNGWGLPLAPSIDPNSWQGELAAAHEAKRQERIAAAVAAEDRLLREVEAAEALRVREWERHRPRREQAFLDLDRLKPELDQLECDINKLESPAAVLRQRRAGLRFETQRFGKPISEL